MTITLLDSVEYNQTISFRSDLSVRLYLVNPSFNGMIAIGPGSEITVKRPKKNDNPHVGFRNGPFPVAFLN